MTTNVGTAPLTAMADDGLSDVEDRISTENTLTLG